MVLLIVLALGGVGLALEWPWRHRQVGNGDTLPAPEIVWAFESTERGGIVSSPCLTADRIYVGVIQDAGLATHGIVYCLERATGKEVWRFTDEGNMKQMASSPCLAEGRLYIGEGMHGENVCKFYCLDAATGHKNWHVTTQGHIESSPSVVDDRVYFGSGDDGIYCLDAVSGEKLWHYQADVHVDSSPAVLGHRLYAGSGLSRRFRSTAAICLDTRDGQVCWRKPTELPVWGSPALDGSEVYFGLGNGRLTESVSPPEQPAGALLCLDAANGERRWCYPVADGVLAQPVVDRERVYFTSRDGSCYALEKSTARLVWKQELGSPIVTRPMVAGGKVYLAASGGRVACFAAAEGRPLWRWDVAAQSRSEPRLYSSPAVFPDQESAMDRHYLYLGTELRGPVSSAAVLYCLQEPSSR
jgi:outer membrane protein assembly factor BamB